MQLRRTAVQFLFVISDDSSHWFQLALSDLQEKAEREINKAKQLISEKDAELQAAEDSLSGLEEVQHASSARISFCFSPYSLFKHINKCYF